MVDVKVWGHLRWPIEWHRLNFKEAVRQRGSRGQRCVPGSVQPFSTGIRGETMSRLFLFLCHDDLLSDDGAVLVFRKQIVDRHDLYS
jgi:hypothetical protein